MLDREIEISHKVKMKKLKIIIIKYLCNNYGALKIICTSLCFGLIFDIFLKYLVEKPTLTSSTRTIFTGENFPVITLCHYEQIDKRSLESNGFKNLYYYRTGEGDISYKNETHQKIGWNGNGSKSVFDVHMRIALLKSAMDCPRNSSFWFEKKHKDFEKNLVEKKPLSFSLTRALYPNHKCCKINLPDLEDVNIVKAIRIADASLNSEVHFRSYKLYLSDQISDSPFTLAKNFNLGDDVTITKDDIGMHKRYKIKVSQEHHVEGNPKYPCIKYLKHGKYGECLEKEMIKITKKLLNCTPPWITDNKVQN